jgi:hypothetical protein
MGCISNVGSYSMQMQLRDCYLDGIDIDTIDDYLQFDLDISDDMLVIPSRQCFDIENERFVGQLVVGVCGSVKKTNESVSGIIWDASLELSSK